jgi:tetratricopeptide (TPR) repeat protein
VENFGKKLVLNQVSIRPGSLRLMTSLTGRLGALLSVIAMSGGTLWAQSAASSGTSAQPTPSGAATVSVETDNKGAEPEPPLTAATELLRNGKLAEAESVYRAFLISDPKSATGFVGLFRVLLRQKRLTEAASALTKAIELAPDSTAVRTAQSELLFRQGRIAEAHAVLTPLVKAGTSEARAYLGLGRIYWASSYYQHAKLMFDKAHERDPSDPDIRKFWLFTLTRKERIEELKSYLKDAGAEDEDEREHLASSLVEMREDEKETSKGCRLVSTVEETHIPMERMLYGATRLKGYGLKVQLNDAKARLLIDTGSTGILVNRKLGEKAGIEPIVKTDVHGIGDKGAVSSFVGLAKSIKIGDLEFQGCHVEVMDRNSVADEDGLIGADVFGHFLVNINFPDGKLELTQLPPLPPPSAAEKALTETYPKIARFRDGFVPPELKNFTPVYRFGHQLLIPTRINDLPAKLFLIDTGAFTDTISPDAAREVTKVHSNTDYKVKGLNGLVNNVFTADNLTLTFSHYRQPARDVVAFDTSRMSNATGTEVSGTLGFAMLYQLQLKIDYRDGLVDFVYEPNRFH